MTEDTHSVLVVSKDSKLSQSLKAMLLPPVFESTFLSDFNEARRQVSERVYNIIIVDYAEGEGTNFALDISDSISTIMILTPSEYFEHVSHRVEICGILTAVSPFDMFYFYNMIKAAIAVQYKSQVLFSKTTQLKDKMEEIKVVNRAKMLLMQNMSMTEQEAHRYLEKEAMDRGKKRIAIAEDIIKTYG
ncbi:MAG: ANTAR domain-containing protein [Treponema sp.]|nr:ANTAR domain-containing protein [Treponema sp.]MBP5451501.1 ANTAR domain-containing protein [Treponema sp.]